MTKPIIGICIGLLLLACGVVIAIKAQKIRAGALKRYAKQDRITSWFPPIRWMSDNETEHIWSIRLSAAIAILMGIVLVLGGLYNLWTH